MDKNRAATVELARTFLGVPFVHQGRSRAGVDCLGLVICTLQEQGILPPDFERRNYSRSPSENDALTRGVARYCTPLETPAHGCMLTLAWFKNPPHVALYADDLRNGPTLIHADARRGVQRVVEHGYRGAWLRLRAAAWALPTEPVT